MAAFGSARIPVPHLERWPVPNWLETSPAVEYRNRFARELVKRPLTYLVESYVYVSPEQMARFVRRACRAVGVELQGVGLELGAGCGLLGATLARSPKVERVWCIEICEEMAALVIPKVAVGILGKQAHKIVPVFGSFDDLRLPDKSVDFAVEMDSLHHSDNLEVTLAECRRVLRPGGYALCFDRCHPDTLSDAEVDRMLSQVYDRKFLLNNCYPPDVVLTRRENGEHEYRLFEWQGAFRSAGLELLKMTQFRQEIRPGLALKGLLRTVLPAALRRRLYETENATLATTLSWIRQELTAPLQSFLLGPRDSTAFLLRRG